MKRCLKPSGLVMDGLKLAGLPLGELLFNFAFAIYFFTTFLSRTTCDCIVGIPVDSLCSIFQILILGLLAAKIILQRMSPRQWAITISFVAIGFVTWRCSKEGWLFWLFMFIAAGKNVEYRRIARIILVESAVLTATTIICSQIGVIENLTIVRAGASRQSLGFSHPNTFGLYLLVICVSISTVRFGENPIPDIVLLLVTLLINLNWANSRSSAVICLLGAILLAVFYFIKSPRQRMAASIVMFSIVLLAILFSYWTMVRFDASNYLMQKIDSLFSGRLHLMHDYYELGGVTIFGQDFNSFDPIYWADGKWHSFVVDNTYAHLFIRCGLIPSLLFYAGFFSLWIGLIHNRCWDARLYGLFLFSLYGLMETSGIRVEANFSLLCISGALLFPDTFIRTQSVSSGGAKHVRHD